MSSAYDPRRPSGTESTAEPQPLNQPGQPAAGTGAMTGSWQGGSDESSVSRKDQASSAVDDRKEQLRERADAGLEQASSGLESAASTLRQQGEERGGTAETAMTKVAAGLEKGSGALAGKDSEQLIADLEKQVRERPIESVVVAAAAGFLLAKVLR